MNQTDAIVLSVAPYRETTLLVNLLTREAGVVRALAKGARRAGRAPQAAFEPFSWVRVNLYLKSPEKLGTLGEVALVRGWDYLRTDVERLAYAGLGLEVLGALGRDSPPEPFFFEEACRFLDQMGATAGPGSLLIALLLRLLHQAGFPPHLAEPWTAETVPQSLTYHFERSRFERPSPTDPTTSMRLPGKAVRPLLAALTEPSALDGSFQASTSAGPALLRWLVRVWEDHLHTRLKAAEFLEKMVLKK